MEDREEGCLYNFIIIQSARIITLSFKNPQAGFVTSF